MQRDLGALHTRCVKSDEKRVVKMQRSGRRRHGTRILCEDSLVALGVVRARPRRVLPLGSLEALCVSRLPRYMLPEIVATELAFPRTRTGKIDRAALAARFASEGGS